MGYHLSIFVYLTHSFTMCKFSIPIKKFVAYFHPKKNFHLNFLKFLVACGNNCRTIGNIFHYLACEIVNWNGSSVYCFFMSYSTLLFMKMIEPNEGVIQAWEEKHSRCKAKRGRNQVTDPTQHVKWISIHLSYIQIGIIFGISRCIIF